MAYVSTLPTTENRSRPLFGRRLNLRESLALWFGSGGSPSEERRALAYERALRDLDRRQLNDIGIYRDAC